MPSRVRSARTELDRRALNGTLDAAAPWRCAVFVLSVLVVATALIAAPARSETLAEFYGAVREADPRLGIGAASGEIAAARSRQALAQLLPQAAVQAQLTRTRQERNSLFDTEPVYYDGERYGVTLQQPVFDWRRIRQYQSSRAVLRQSAHEFEGTSSEVRFDAIDRYLKALSAAEKLRLARQEEQTLATQRDQLQSLFRRQMAKVTDLLTVEARADTAQAQRLAAEAEYRVARDALGELAGRPVETLAGLAEDAVLPGVEATLAAAEARSASANAMLRARREAADRARLDVAAERARRLPVLGLQLAAQKTNIGYENILSPRTETEVIALNASMPLFAGGALSAATREARARQRIADLELEQATREVQAATRAAHLRLQGLAAQAAAARRAVESTRRSVEASDKGFRLGVATLVDLLDARRDTFAAERDYADVRHEYLRQWALLAHLTAALDDAMLMRLGALLARPVVVAEPAQAAVNADAARCCS